MLTTVEAVQRLPGLRNLAIAPIEWLNDLIGEADAGIKQYLRRDIELTYYDTEYKTGKGRTDIWCKQWPVLVGVTTIAGGSAGVALPTGTINVASTAGFHPGTFGDTSLTSPRITVQVGTNSFTTVQYTGTTATSFTGCTGGSGTISSAGQVWSPCVWQDANGMGGQKSGGFADGTLQIIGTNFMVNVDGGGGGSGSGATGSKSARGTISKILGGPDWWPGYYPATAYTGKLAGVHEPVWPIGRGNIRVSYAAGYLRKDIPLGIVNACKQLVAWMARNNPSGSALSSENLGSYSYSLLSGKPEDNEIGHIQKLLARHVELALGDD